MQYNKYISTRSFSRLNVSTKTITYRARLNKKIQQLIETVGSGRSGSILFKINICFSSYSNLSLEIALTM